MNHTLDKERLKWLTDKTNRSLAQTQFLFDLLEGDFEKLKMVEMKIKNCLLYYCPADMEAVNEILQMTDVKILLEL